MKVFLDTNVLVAASVAGHPHHQQAFAVVDRVVAGRDKGFMSMHSIAEIYAALTRVPVVPRIHPTEASQILCDSVLPLFQCVPVGKRDYLKALETVRAGGWLGARIYDALLLGCAAKCSADRIYTFNLADFQSLSPPALRQRILTP